MTPKNTALVRLPLIIYLAFFSTASAQDKSDKFKDLWGQVSKKSADVIDSSLVSFKNITDEVGNVIDAELEYLLSKNSDSKRLEVKDKIDTIRIYVENITTLKKDEENASSFTLIGMSKKDYRVKIDEVLQEIEPILFDGEVVNYATKIREVRAQIKSLESQKANLNEDLVFASDKKQLFGSSKDEVRKELKEINRVIGN